MTTPAEWHDFAAMIGSASGALTGLLFVAVSLNAKRIAGHAGLRASAAQTLVLFITPLLIAATLLVPRQADWLLGAELTAVAVAAGLVLSVEHHAKLGLGTQDLRLISIFNRRRPYVAAMLLIMAGGLTLASGESAGLYLLYPGSVVTIISGVLNAWYFLLPPSDSTAQLAAPGQE
jgi:modulator of FtsH protease